MTDPANQNQQHDPNQAGSHHNGRTTMPASTHSRPLRTGRRTIAVTVLGLGVALTLAACGGGSTSAGSDPTSASSSATASSGGSGSTGGTSGGAGTNGPAASGLIAAVDGTTMQVQSQQNGQVAVDWTSTTTFTEQVTVAASTIKAGDCVTAIGASDSSTSSSTASTAFTAATVTVSEPTNGTCTGGFGGAGTRPSDAPTGAAPSGAPAGGTAPTGAPGGGAAPSGAPGGAANRTSAIASGSVVSVSGSTLVIASRDFGSGTSGSTTTNKTVTLDSTTRITTEKTATSTAVKTGLCATAQGAADDTGTVTATSIALTQSVDGTCTSGFGGFGRGGNGGQAGTSGGTTTGGSDA